MRLELWSVSFRFQYSSHYSADSTAMFKCCNQICSSGLMCLIFLCDCQRTVPVDEPGCKYIQVASSWAFSKSACSRCWLSCRSTPAFLSSAMPVMGNGPGGRQIEAEEGDKLHRVYFGIKRLSARRPVENQYSSGASLRFERPYLSVENAPGPGTGFYPNLLSDYNRNDSPV